jgi:hypothetical protein
MKKFFDFLFYIIFFGIFFLIVDFTEGYDTVISLLTFFSIFIFSITSIIIFIEFVLKKKRIRKNELINSEKKLNESFKKDIEFEVKKSNAPMTAIINFPEKNNPTEEKQKRLKEFHLRKITDAGIDAVALYIMQTGSRKQIKIGISNNPQLRLKEFQTGNPHIKLCSYYWLESRDKARKIEFNLHVLLEAINKKIVKYSYHGTEWFSVTPKVANNILENFFLEIDSVDLLSYVESYAGDKYIMKLRYKKNEKALEKLFFCHAYIILVGRNVFQETFQKIFPEAIDFNLYSYPKYNTFYNIIFPSFQPFQTLMKLV